MKTIYPILLTVIDSYAKCAQNGLNLKNLWETGIDKYLKMVYLYFYRRLL
jgi:hypothetical protein